MNKDKISVSEAKAKFFKVTERAGQGKEIIILKKGSPQTVIMSYEKYKSYKEAAKNKNLELADRIKQHRNQQKLQSDSAPLIEKLRQGRF